MDTITSGDAAWVLFFSALALITIFLQHEPS